MQLTIDYRLTGLGWAECTVADESSSCTVSASYLSDALAHMLVAATAVISLFARVTFRFEEEPGEYRWVITSPRTNEIEIRVLDFNESWGEKPDEEGKLLFKTKCLPITFARAVHQAAQRLLTEFGEQGYLDKWSEHPFPMFQYQELGRLLAQENCMPSSAQRR